MSINTLILFCRRYARTRLVLAGGLLLVVSLTTVGCQVAPPTQAGAPIVNTVNYLTVGEMAATLEEEELLLVEFCVPSGCVRCDQMRRPIESLASDLGEDVTVKRVNINHEPGLAWEFGVTVCPTYVAFRNGEEVYRAAYPTSADLIASAIDESLSEVSNRTAPHPVR